MTTTTIYNTDKIISIEIEPRKLEKDWVYVKNKNLKKSFWNRLFNPMIEEGWYFEDPWNNLHGPYSSEDLESGKYYGVNFQIFGGKAYYKPFLRINFVDGSKFSHPFESEEQIKLFLKTHKIEPTNKFEIRRLDNEK